jgi:hypothetical protein
MYDMEDKYGLGESFYLKEPYLGYRHVEIVGYEFDRLLVRLTSGLEITVHPDELED